MRRRTQCVFPVVVAAYDCIRAELVTIDASIASASQRSFSETYRKPRGATVATFNCTRAELATIGASDPHCESALTG